MKMSNENIKKDVYFVEKIIVYVASKNYTVLLPYDPFKKKVACFFNL